MSWGKFKLGDICRIEKGLTGIQKAIPGKFPLVVTGEERKTHNDYQFDEDAVVIPLVSGTGHGHASIKRIHFQTGKFALGNILCAIIPKDKNQLSAGYLYRFLELNKEKELVSRMKGMANVTLPLKEIAAIEIPLPSLDEQMHFVEMYNGLQAQTSKLSSQFSEQISILKQLRQSFLREAMQGKLVEQGTADEPASNLLRKIKAEKEKLISEKKIKKEKKLPPIRDEEIPFDIPKSWVWCRGEEIAEFIDPQPSHRTPSETLDGIPYVSMKDITINGSINFSSARKVNISILKEHQERYTLIAGDFIFGKIGTIGKPVILTEPFNYTLSANLILIQGNRLLINVKFLFYFLSSPFAVEHIYDNKSEMSYPVFGMKKARMIPIPLPPLPEQHRIVAKLEQLMALCDEMESIVKESKEQNERLLQEVLKEAMGLNE